jgi:acyl-CoA synthetase (AMP-forming)/AMP-acid ligase II
VTTAAGPSDTVADRLARHSVERPGDVAFRFVGRHASETRSLSWGDLHAEAAAIAGGLDRLAGRPAVILCPDPRDFVVALAGCLLAGVVAVPVPGVATRRAAGRIESIIAAAAPAVIIAPERLLAQPWMAELTAPGGMATRAVEALRTAPPARPDVRAQGESALIQFTSGSTGAPRGVALSHGNLASNCQAIVEAYGLSPATRGFSWLPLHHDMGLVGHVLTPFWIGCRSTIMDPLLFLQSPLRWLRRAGEEGATITSAPNFAYQLCVKAAVEGGEVACEGIDLSTVTAAVCGGEPVWPETVDAFSAAFAASGFDRSAFAPSYGLAESTLLVSSGRRSGGPRVFSGSVRSGDAPPGTAEVRAVLLGPPVRGAAVRIVDEAGATLPDDVVGEIEISGPSVGRVAGDGATGAARTLTGDIGFLHGGELVVTGRRKELMILRGANVYPADAEAAASAADPVVSPAGIAAFGLAADGTEEMVMAFEVTGGALPAERFDAIARRINEAVGRATGHVPAAIVAVAHGALPRTTSGKIRRHALGALCHGGGIDVLNTTDHKLVPAKGADRG